MKTEDKALALLNEVHGDNYSAAAIHGWTTIYTALCRAIEQHETTKQEFSDFRQEVSDAVGAYLKWSDECLLAKWDGFDRFIIPKPKPDPLVDVAKSLGYYNTAAKHWAGDVHAALGALGFEIREKNDD